MHSRITLSVVNIINLLSESRQIYLNKNQYVDTHVNLKGNTYRSSSSSSCIGNTSLSVPCRNLEQFTSHSIFIILRLYVSPIPRVSIVTPRRVFYPFRNFIINNNNLHPTAAPLKIDPCKARKQPCCCIHFYISPICQNTNVYAVHM